MDSFICLLTHLFNVYYPRQSARSRARDTKGCVGLSWLTVHLRGREQDCGMKRSTNAPASGHSLRTT